MDATELALARAAAVADRPDLLGGPVQIRDELGQLRGWFVPLIDGDRLVGFVELDQRLVHRRTSRFPVRSGTPDHPPPASWWLDSAVIARHAAPAMQSDEETGEPYLSFDGVPDRLAWAVPIVGPRGTRVVFVAGAAAWPAAERKRLPGTIG